MPFARIPQAETATGRDRRLILSVVAAVLAALVAVGIYAAVRPGSYDGSRNGCITVNVPSSMGGSLIHQCGADARATCTHAYRSSDKVSLLTRPQCRLAGLRPAKR